MAARKNHHFVPQFYFRRFSTDGRSISLLRRGNGQPVRQASIKSQSSKDRFYGSDAVENALGDVETARSSALHALAATANPATLDPEDVERVLVWLTLQRARTDAARRASQPMHDQLMRLFAEVAINNDGELTAEERAVLRGTLEHVTTDPASNQTLEMGIALEHALALRDLCPLLLDNRTNRPFIFGDAPVVLYNGLYRDVRLRGVLGFDTAGLMVCFPLGPKLCLLLVDAASYRIRGASSNRVALRDFHDVQALNKLQLHAASSCVYFNDFRYAPYVVELWRQEQAALAAPAASVMQAPGFDATTGAPIGDIVHFFLPQLPYRLSLTFLEHDVRGDEDAPPGRRSQRT